MHTPNDIILKRPIRCKVNTYSETYVTLGRASLVIKSQGVLRTIRGQYDTAAGLSIPAESVHHDTRAAHHHHAR